MVLKGKVEYVCISEKKGIPKKTVENIYLIENFGIKGDAHASSFTHRQVSFLAIESINKMREKGIKVKDGGFAENIATSGINLLTLKIGDRLSIGENAVLEVTQLGKECHHKCAIYYQAGYCIMPTEGIFARVIKSGEVKKGDQIICEKNQ
jgi:MOSC domain-containing protein YiiM